MLRRILLMATWIGYLATSRSAALAPSALLVAAGLLWLFWAPRPRRQVAAAVVTVVAGVGVLLEFPLVDRCAVHALPVVLNGVAALAFGRTLQAGRTPLIAERYPDECRRYPELSGYLRALTRLWAISLAALSLTALAFALYAPPRIWWLVVNRVDYAVLALLFAGEYVYRRAHFPHHEHQSFPQFVRRVLSWRDGVGSGP